MAEQHDLFCKHLLFEALEPISRAEMEKPIAVLDAQYVDLYCEPLPERPSPDQLPHLGLLFRMTEWRCLFEPFSDSPAIDDIDNNLRKQLALHHLLRRGCKPERPPKPILWILSPGRPEEVIRSFALQPAADWPTGFYAAAPGLQLFVVVIAELPKTPETRLLRLLGSRWERFRAVREVLNLPTGDVQRQPVVALLLAFRYFFVGTTSRTQPSSGNSFP